MRTPSTRPAVFRRSLRLAPIVLAWGCAATSPRAGEPAPAAPSPTRVRVHAVTHDAKLIGTSVGGVRITIVDVATGRLLAEGRHEGGTGDTRRIMQTTRNRGDTLFVAADGARFETELALRAPTLVEIAAEGPLGYPDQMARTAKRLVLLPGGDVGGDGIVLELHGYVLDLLAPDTTAALPAGAPVAVRARVRMLCSCPTQPGGMWEASTVEARLLQGDRVVHRGALAYAGETSHYMGTLPPPTQGRYTLEVVAASHSSATFGVVRRSIVVGR